MPRPLTTRKSMIVMTDVDNIDLTIVSPLMADLIKELFDEESQYKRMSYDPFNNMLEEKLSLNHLKEIMHQHGNLNAARKSPKNDNRFTFSRKDRADKFTQQIVAACGGFWRPSGLFWYPPKSYCGWHTNNNNQGRRVYLAWAEEGDKSFFRYYDQDKDKIVTTWDKKGLNIHHFEVSKEKPCWHCVGSYTNRISLGFMRPLEQDGYEEHLAVYGKYPK